MKGGEGRTDGGGGVMEAKPKPSKLDLDNFDWSIPVDAIRVLSGYRYNLAI